MNIKNHTKKRFLSLVILTIFIFSTLFFSNQPLPVKAAGYTYYVSVAGNDTTGTGSIANPWRTIQKAADTMSAGDTCIIRAGTYRETVTPPVSGTSGNPITFRAYTGETVTMDGCDPLSNWTQHSGCIYKTTEIDSSWNLDDQNQIFVDASMMTEARWPNNTGSLLQPTLAVADKNTTSTTIIDDALTEADNHYEDAKVWCVAGAAWLSQSSTITASSQANHSITFNSLSHTDPHYIPKIGNMYFIYGKYDLLDTTNEWYFDSSASTLYFWAPGGVNPSTLTVKAKKRLNAFNLSGRSYINIDGLDIFASRIQTDSSTSNCIIENVTGSYLSHSNNNDLCYNSQQNFGILLDGSNNELRSCVLEYSSASLVTVNGSNNRVINCQMTYAIFR